MKRVMVRYKVKADRAAENENYTSKVFEQLKNDRPSGLRLAGEFAAEQGSRVTASTAQSDNLSV